MDDLHAPRTLHPARAVAFPQVLPGSECSSLFDELLRCRSRASEPYSPAVGRRKRDSAFAPSSVIVGRPAHYGRLREAIRNATSELEHFFARPLKLGSDVRFVRYERGAYIKPHVDVADGPHVPRDVRERSVVFTLPLTGAPNTGLRSHGGGILELYVRLPDPLEVDAAPGTLVAFDARVIHAVTPVTSGTRIAAVGWFRTTAAHQRRGPRDRPTHLGNT